MPMLVSMLYTIVNAWTVINDEIYSEYIVIHVQVCVYIKWSMLCIHSDVLCMRACACVLFWYTHLCVTMRLDKHCLNAANKKIYTYINQIIFLLGWTQFSVCVPIFYTTKLVNSQV